MATNTIPGPGPGIVPTASSYPPPADPFNQIAYIPNTAGTPIPFTTTFVTGQYMFSISLSILYGSQIGACFMMLCVVLAMTPRSRFRRLPTLISIAALTVNMVRMVLLAVFFTTTWLNFYVVASQDSSVIPRRDYEISAAGTVLSVPVTMLILAALVVQAWSMIRLWRTVWKVSACVVSGVLVVTTIAFNTMSTVIQTKGILWADPSTIARWVRQTYLALITASICWFCFLFNVRLVMHMWTNRSILPSLKGLKAMDVLVITNGILMFVPVIFAALEFFDWDNFEPGSITQTSVIIVLPLGTLVAQRLANPGWFSTAPDTSHPSNSTGLTSLSTSRGGGHITLSGATVTNSTQRPLLRSLRSSDGRDVVHRGAGRSAVSTHIAAASEGSISEKGRAFHADGDDTLMDRDAVGVANGGDLERGQGGVRVDYGIERVEERLPRGSS